MPRCCTSKPWVISRRKQALLPTWLDSKHTVHAYTSTHTHFGTSKPTFRPVSFYMWNKETLLLTVLPFLHLSYRPRVTLAVKTMFHDAMSCSGIYAWQSHWRRCGITLFQAYTHGSVLWWLLPSLGPAWGRWWCQGIFSPESAGGSL